MEKNDDKPEHHRIAMYRHLFTSSGMKLIRQAIKRDMKLSFMRRVPGNFTIKNKNVYYTDSFNVTRMLVPTARIKFYLEKLYKDEQFPKGQASFANAIADRYIGISQLEARNFIATKGILQMARNLPKKPTKRGPRGWNCPRPTHPYIILRGPDRKHQGQRRSAHQHNTRRF